MMTLKLIIYKILNFSPIFHCSNDEYFGELNDISKLRFSIFSIAFGQNKIYILTYNKDERKFSWGFRLNLELLHLDKSVVTIDYNKKFIEQKQKEIREKKNIHKNYILGRLEPEIEIYTDFLKENFLLNNAVLESIRGKSYQYLTILTTLVPIILSFFIIYFFIFKYTIILIIISIIIFYNFINLALFLYPMLGMTTVIRASLIDIKNNINPTNNSIALLPFQALNVSYYENWYASKEERKLNASILKNMIKYFRNFALWAMIPMAIIYCVVESQKEDVKEKVQKNICCCFNENLV